MSKPTPESSRSIQPTSPTWRGADGQVTRFPFLAIVDNGRPRLRPVSPVRTDGVTVEKQGMLLTALADRSHTGCRQLRTLLPHPAEQLEDGCIRLYGWDDRVVVFMKPEAFRIVEADLPRFADVQMSFGDPGAPVRVAADDLPTLPRRRSGSRTSPSRSGRGSCPGSCYSVVSWYGRGPPKTPFCPPATNRLNRGRSPRRSGTSGGCACRSPE